MNAAIEGLENSAALREAGEVALSASWHVGLSKRSMHMRPRITHPWTILWSRWRAQAGVARFNDRVGPVGHLQFGEDVADIVAYRFAG